jgi:ADP-heptose:LPS heptosyltransferase
MTRPRVVALRALGLGDLLTAVPALRALRAAHPDARLTLVGPRSLAALLPERLVDDVRDLSLVRGIDPAVSLDPDLRGADLAVNLHGRGPQSTELLRQLGPRRLLGYGVTSTWREDEHEVARWCRLVEEAGIRADPKQLSLPVPPEPPVVEGAVVLHPGAALPTRRWPAERWSTVARWLLALDQRVVVTGGADERELALEVAAGAGVPEGDVVAGRTSVRQLAALVAASRLLLAPDTGVAHLATALGTPSVVLFGPTPPALWGPPADRPWHRALWAGRTGDNDAGDPDPGLLALHPADVLAEAVRLLSHGRRDGGPARTVNG